MHSIPSGSHGTTLVYGPSLIIMSPSQRLFCIGRSLQLHQSGLTAVEFFEHVPQDYGTVLYRDYAHVRNYAHPHF